MGYGDEARIGNGYGNVKKKTLPLPKNETGIVTVTE